MNIGGVPGQRTESWRCGRNSDWVGTTGVFGVIRRCCGSSTLAIASLNQFLEQGSQNRKRTVDLGLPLSSLMSIVLALKTTHSM